MSKQKTTKTATANAKSINKLQAEIDRLRAELGETKPTKKGKMTFAEFCEDNETVASVKSVWNAQKQLIWNGSATRFNVEKAIKAKVTYADLLDIKSLVKRFPYKG